MVIIPPPLSNAERQRLFQLRHPGYDRRRKSRERASAKRGAAQLFAALQAKAAAEANRPVLMLPAPVENPVLVELDALAAARASSVPPEPLRLAQQAELLQRGLAADERR
ncbi:MAG: hypothetical protein WBD40_21720 [Tepidisphaeraceae bacterium]